VSFCRDTLCVGEASVWLCDGAMLRRVDVAAGNGAVHEAPYAGDAEAALAAATGSSFACALRAGGRLLGVLAVGSAAREAILDDEDREVVRHVAAQIGSALELHRLGEEIADAREVASFHRVSTFVIHDLKNLVAQQSFVLENASRFGENPAFVRDALDAFTDSTDRMRSLIGRLRSREKVARVNGSACNLVEVVRELANFPRLALPPGSSLNVLVPDAAESYPVPLDRSAAVQVLTNLIGNALESLSEGEGQVTVAITRQSDICRLDVSDNGRGIPPEFVREHLFRPFRTTKENGLGIGLYQCKTTVEAAGGAIAIRSDLNVGTTVSVTLPALAEGAPSSWSGDHEQKQSVGR
jgi:putative PEP-CTERM system histidine kinase